MIMSTSSRFNDHFLCVVCRCRADGLAVGKPEKLAWYCKDCGPRRARRALMTKKFDVFEERACCAVAEFMGTSEITLRKDEMADFVRWVVEEFGNALRKDLESDNPPF